MYDQDIQSVTMKPRRRSYLPLAIIMLLVAGFIVLFSWGAGRRPKTYHRVGAFPLHMEGSDDLLLGAGITPCLGGFCVREDAFVFTLRDWETGKELWQVSTAIPYADPKKAKIAWTGEFHAAVSPDGHRFAAASSDDNNLLVQTWQDGAGTGEVKIALPPLLPPGFIGMPSAKMLDEVVDLRASITDEGRCFIALGWKLSPVPSQAFVIEDGAIVARYSGKEYPEQFAPDGSAAMLSTDKLVKVIIEGKTLRFADPVKLPSVKGTVPGAGGTAVTADGGIYRLSGKPVIAKGFACDTVTTSGKYAILTRGQLTRAIDLHTGDSWEVTVPQKNEGGDATEDGKHILATFISEPGGLTGMLRNAVGAQNYFVVLYERPDRQRAWMRLDRLRPFSWWPSPDGRSLALTTSDECLLYRW